MKSSEMVMCCSCTTIQYDVKVKHLSSKGIFNQIRYASNDKLQYIYSYHCYFPDRVECGCAQMYVL